MTAGDRLPYVLTAVRSISNVLANQPALADHWAQWDGFGQDAFINGCPTAGGEAAFIRKKAAILDRAYKRLAKEAPALLR